MSWTQTENVALYIMGTLEELREKSILVFEPSRLLPIGWAEYIALKGFGFRPTEAEVRECLGFSGTSREDLVMLVVRYACEETVDGH